VPTAARKAPIATLIPLRRSKPNLEELEKNPKKPSLLGNKEIPKRSLM